MDQFSTKVKRPAEPQKKFIRKRGYLVEKWKLSFTDGIRRMQRIFLDR